MSGTGQRMVALCATLIPPMALSGCLALAAPLMPVLGVGMGAFTTFQSFKVVQLSTGGSVHVEFRGADGKTAPAQPMPTMKRIAVWPGDAGNVEFAQKLSASGRYGSVAGPETVSGWLRGTSTTLKLADLTDSERNSAFASVCHRGHIEFIFAAITQGTSTDLHEYSFSRASATYTNDLYGYSCAQKSVVWRDHMALVAEVGSSTPNEGEIKNIAGDAWAARVFQSPSG